jgi:hypothetical protein
MSIALHPLQGKNCLVLGDSSKHTLIGRNCIWGGLGEFLRGYECSLSCHCGTIHYAIGDGLVLGIGRNRPGRGD